MENNTRQPALILQEYINQSVLVKTIEDSARVQGFSMNKTTLEREQKKLEALKLEVDGLFKKS